jgi:hypothetical protein
VGVQAFWPPPSSQQTYPADVRHGSGGHVDPQNFPKLKVTQMLFAGQAALLQSSVQ